MKERCSDFRLKIGRAVRTWVIALLAIHLATIFVKASEPVSDATSPLLEADRRYERPYEGIKDWRGQPMRYCVTMPTSFDPQKRYPILLEWPGKGGGPETDVFRSVYGVRDHIHVGLAYPEGSKQGEAMLYATPAYVQLMRHVYDDVVNDFHGHPEYVFIGGYSAGGFMATGPGISLMIRAGLREKLAGVLAGGCNWMSDPRYVHGQNVLLWYAAKDSNSSDLARRLSELREHADDLEVIRHEDGAHTVRPEVEGPAIRRFLERHGPNAKAELDQRPSMDRKEAACCPNEDA